MSEQVPEGWKSIPLINVSNKSDRYSFTGGPFGSNLKSEDYTISGIRIIQLQNIGEGRFLNTHKIYTSSEKADELFSCNIYPGDIILSKMGDPVARAALIPNISERYLMASDGIRLSVDKNRFDTNFIHEAINSEAFRKQAETNSTGTTRKRIGLTDLRKLTIITPPKPEQIIIASILTSVDEVIEKTESQINKLQDLKKGMMQELLTKGIGHTEFKDSPVGRIPKEWDVVEFGLLFHLKNGVNKGKEFFGQGVPIISYKNVYSGGGIYLSDILGKVDLTPSEIERFNVFYGDVFFTRTSETVDEIGLSNVYLGKPNNVVFNGFVIRARPSTNRLSATFCKYCFSSYSVRQQMIFNCKYTTRAGISGESLAKIRMVVPPIDEQDEIAQVIDSIERRLSVLTEGVIGSKNLKKALMQDLLTGKVRVNVN